MKHDEFKIGEHFTCGGKTWLCTDVGTRIITALCVEEVDPGWLNGPPYAFQEIVFDEDDFAACVAVERSL